MRNSNSVTIAASALRVIAELDQVSYATMGDQARMAVVFNHIDHEARAGAYQVWHHMLPFGYRVHMVGDNCKVKVNVVKIFGKVTGSIQTSDRFNKTILTLKDLRQALQLIVDTDDIDAEADVTVTAPKPASKGRSGRITKEQIVNAAAKAAQQ